MMFKPGHQKDKTYELTTLYNLGKFFIRQADPELEGTWTADSLRYHRDLIMYLFDAQRWNTLVSVVGNIQQLESRARIVRVFV